MRRRCTSSTRSTTPSSREAPGRRIWSTPPPSPRCRSWPGAKGLASASLPTRSVTARVRSQPKIGSGSASRDATTRSAARVRQRAAPGVGSYLDATATYDCRREDHGWPEDGDLDAVAAGIEREIDSIESEDAVIATVESVFRKAEVLRRGNRRQLEKGDELLVTDKVQTGPRGLLKFRLLDRPIEKDAGPSVFNVMPASEVELLADRRGLEPRG